MSPRRRDEREGNAKAGIRSSLFFLRALCVFAVIFLFVCNTPVFAASEARALLDKRLPAAKLDNVALADAIDFLRDISGVNITVDWKALEAINISKNTQINLNLHDVSAGKVLSLILAEAGPGDLLTYYIDQNVVEITTREVADQKMVTVVYYVMDLLQPNDTFDYTIQNIGGGSAQVTGGGGGSGTSSIAQGGQNNANGKTMDDKATDLIKLIETVVRPEVWRDNGGQASMAYLNGNLIVTAPRSVQEAIGGPID
jgi:hypothetical protein